MDKILDQLQGLRSPLVNLSPMPGNPRRGDVDAVARSLTVFGQHKPIVARRTGEDGEGRPVGVVLAGNHTLAAAIKLGWDALAVVWTDDDEMTAKARALADNHTAELGSYDDQALLDMLRDVAADEDLFAATAYTGDDVEKMLAALGDDSGDGDGDDIKEDEVPEVAEEVVTRRGDVWLLGPHRVMCGDSTSAEDVAVLMAGESCQIVVTDPPYCSGGFQESGRAQGSVGSVQGKTGQIANDRLSTRGYQALVKRVLELADTPYAYVFTDWRMWITLFELVESSGYGVRSMIVWDKGTPGMGRGWRTQHELVMFGAKQTPDFNGHDAMGNVIQSKRTGNKLHLTEKPVDLVAKLMHVSRNERTVYDPFGGSGTTLVAAHQMGRVARLMEMEPGYVDVICRRWEQLTGETPVNEATGEPRSFV